DQERIHEALMVGNQQSRAMTGNVLVPFGAQAKAKGHHRGGEPINVLIPKVGRPRFLHQQSQGKRQGPQTRVELRPWPFSFFLTSCSKRSTTSSSERRVVSRMIASAAGTMGARSRAVSR